MNGKPYWLVNAPGEAGGYAESCVQQDQDQVCQDNQFPGPPGVDVLGDYNLSIDDLVTSSVNSYAANGNKNGFVIDLSKASTIDDLTTNSVRAAGVFTIPICTQEEAHMNWSIGPQDGSANYPCN